MIPEISFCIFGDENKKISRKLVWDVVRIHQNSFKGFFLSFLGPKFLFHLYFSIANSNEGILIIAEHQEDIIGFVAGVTNQKKFYNYLIKKHKWKFAIASIPAILRKPTIVIRLIRAIKKPKEAEEYSSEACLLSIGVDPNYQGEGIGMRLVDEFSKEISKRGCKSFCLTTDKDNNEKANKFYKKLGFILIRTFETPEGRAMNEYLKILNGEI